MKVCGLLLPWPYWGGAGEAAGEVVEEGEFAGDGEFHLRDDGEQLGARRGGDFGDLAMQGVLGVEKRDVLAIVGEAGQFQTPLNWALRLLHHKFDLWDISTDRVVGLLKVLPAKTESGFAGNDCKVESLQEIDGEGTFGVGKNQ